MQIKNQKLNDVVMDVQKEMIMRKLLEVIVPDEVRVEKISEEQIVKNEVEKEVEVIHIEIKVMVEEEEMMKMIKTEEEVEKETMRMTMETLLVMRLK